MRPLLRTSVAATLAVSSSFLPAFGAVTPAADSSAVVATPLARLLRVRPVPIADPDLRGLVEAERAFAALSGSKGVRTAFLANLARDAIVFRPSPVPAVDWFRDRPSPQGTLVWEPDFAAVSVGGDLGYTSGPWEFRETGATPESGTHGHFVTVWRREGGTWKIVIDGGVRHEPGGEVALEFGARASRAPVLIAEAKEVLRRAESELLRAARSATWADVFTRSAAADIRLYRSGSAPIVGLAAGRAALAAHPGSMRWELGGAEASRVGDLGCTWGTAQLHPDGAPGDSVEASAFVRIWRARTHSGYEIVLDLESPIPPPRRP